MKKRRSPLKSRGFALVEVLISILLFSIGVLGLVAMQAKASGYSVDSEDRSRASMLADDLVATMWAEQSSSVSSAALTAWEARLANGGSLGLPGTPTSSVVTTNGVTTITITWNEPKRLNASGTAATSTYTTSVAIP